MLCMLVIRPDIVTLTGTMAVFFTEPVIITGHGMEGIIIRARGLLVLEFTIIHTPVGDFLQDLAMAGFI